MTIIDRQRRVVLIALFATVCAVGLVRAEAQGQGDNGQTMATITTRGAN